jgi:glutaminyl-tRNA synthetase
VDAVKDPASGEVIELRCTYDPETKSGSLQSSRKVKATIHWVSAAHAVEGEARLYDHLFTKENPEEVEEGADWMQNLNPDSLEILAGCKLEPGLSGAAPGSVYQFERIGYFCVDPDSSGARPAFNRTVTLRDTWAKIEKAQKKNP